MVRRRFWQGTLAGVAGTALVLGTYSTLLAAVAKVHRQAGQQTITFIAAAYSTKTQPFWEHEVKVFEAQNPGIHINLEVVSWNNIAQKVTTLIATHQEPDVLNINTWTPYANSGLLLNLNTILPASFRNGFVPAFLRSAQSHGATMALPFVSSVRSLYYNKTYFTKAHIKSPPRTWPELVADAKAIQKAEPNVWGLGMTGMHLEPAYFSYFLWGAGGNWNNAKNRWTFDSRQGIKALTFMNDLVNKYKVTEPNPVAYNRDELEQLFASGKLGMMFTASFFPTILKQEGPNIKWGVGPIPVAPGVKPTTLGVADYLMAFKTTKHPKAVAQWLKFVFSNGPYHTFLNNEGLLPTNKAQSVAMSKESPFFKTVISQLPTAKFQPFYIPTYVQVWEDVSSYLQEVFLGNMTPAVALKQAYQEAVRIP